jgi:hypothetical protein
MPPRAAAQKHGEKFGVAQGGGAEALETFLGPLGNGHLTKQI